MELKTSVGKSFLDLFTNTLAFGGTFAIPISPSTDQSLQKSFHLSHPDKIELKIFSSLKKIKNTQPHNPRQTSTLTGLCSEIPAHRKLAKRL